MPKKVDYSDSETEDEVEYEEDEPAEDVYDIDDVIDEVGEAGESIGIVGGNDDAEVELEEDTDEVDSINIGDYSIRTVMIPPEQNITSDVMTKYEITEAISIRTANIEDGDTPFVNCDDLDDPIEMAKRELLQRRFPYCIIRQVGEEINHEAKTIIRKYEMWDPNEMILNL